MFSRISKDNANKKGLAKTSESTDKKIPKIPDTSNLVTKAAINTNIEETGNNIPDVSGLVTNTSFNTNIREDSSNTPFNTKNRDVKYKIPDHDKYITTAEFKEFSD